MLPAHLAVASELLATGIRRTITGLSKLPQEVAGLLHYVGDLLADERLRWPTIGMAAGLAVGLYSCCKYEFPLQDFVMTKEATLPAIKRALLKVVFPSLFIFPPSQCIFICFSSKLFLYSLYRTFA